MGSCSSEQHSGEGLDTTVGGLVWVRRGNGSWWPGQIMDVDEVSVVPNSSGVPIKLLGRDDVTVDWYNLEMTKKVKAFRCGEHASCIEKAKASRFNPVKKRLKHVCRENAILLALQLESEPTNVSKDKLEKSSPPMKSNQTVVLGLKTREKSDSAPELSHSGISYEEANKITRQRTPNDSEDEGIKKRMKGLDDLGITNLVTESQPELSAASSCVRKKRSKVVLFHDILKRKNRRRMLTKVLQSDTLVSIPIIFDHLPSPPPKASPFVSDNNDSNSTGVSSEYDASSELLVGLENWFDVPLICEAELSDGSPLLTREVSAETNEDHATSAAAAAAEVKTEWQLKGRRNSRQHNRNPETELTMLSYRQSRFSPCLYEVNIEVKGGYHRPQHQHVPYISLMSKLNAKPITGHPITVEVLEDGQSHFLLHEEEDDEPTIRTGNNKKQGCSSSKKTRRLSALTTNYTDRRMVVIRNFKLPALACIPLRVVFSRINEALNGSTRSNRPS